MPRLPNFFIVGAPKTGTTSLYHYLDQHPQIYMSAIKEPHYFASEIRDDMFDPAFQKTALNQTSEVRAFLSGPMREKRFGGTVTDWDDYLRLFANANGEPILGEASVCYLWSPTAAEQIAQRIPDAKILVMLRDPVDRAFAQYMHGCAQGAIRWSFGEHIERSLKRPSELLSVYHPFLEFGLYSQQLSRYLSRFGRNVWIGFHDDFNARPLKVYQDICRFLGVADDFSPSMERRFLEGQAPRLRSIGWARQSGLWGAVARVTPTAVRPFIRRGLMRKPGTAQPDLADRAILRAYYREDVQQLAKLLDRNLDAWT